ncbi:hypothetical protein HYY73_06190 [Candidatus Woesearchaeota archaeon]|nr:hypothetical protein [Candidatus Woesearchaeota archaeon]
MRNNDPFVLWLVAAFFLFLATIPVLAFAFYFKILPLPRLDYGSIAAVAAAGLLVVPFILLLIAAVALASAKRSEFIPKPKHYPWEGVFKQRELAAAAAVVVPGRKVAASVVTPNPSRAGHDWAQSSYARLGKGAGIKAVAVVAVVVLALVALAFFTPKLKEFAIGTGANETAKETANVSVMATANISEKVMVANVSKTNESQNLISALFKKIRAGNNKNETMKVVPVEVAGKAAPANFSRAIANVRSSIGWSAAGIKSRIGKVPYKVWQSVAAAVLAVVLATTVFLSYRTGQLYEVVLWVKGWVALLFSFPSAIMRNKLKSLAIALAAAVICAGVAAFVFRINLFANLGGFASASKAAASNLPSNAGLAIFSLLMSVRNFLLIYRLYVFIGILVLLAVIGILYTLERKGRK